MKASSAVLLITCPDQRGIVAAVADFLYRNGANILHSDQHQDTEMGLFLMRIEWDGYDPAEAEFEAAFAPVAQKFGMTWRLALAGRRPRVAVLVSRYDHCLTDLLYRHRAGELPCEIPLIVSNHPDHRHWAEFYQIPFFEVGANHPASTPVLTTAPGPAGAPAPTTAPGPAGAPAPTTPGSRAQTEAQILALFHKHQIDVVVLARYMQILSPEFVKKYPQRIINIHHSFLPAFLGGRPYHRAFERGVKLIGATSHYVTDVLDEGPIIEQDVIRISHRDVPADLIQKGRDLEKIILSRALLWHLENRILIYANKTVVFA